MNYRDKIESILKKLPHKLQVRYALDCCYEIKDLITDQRSIKALEITELWLIGKATDAEVKDAATAATTYANAAYAAYAAAYATTYANAAYAAYAAYAADKPIKYFYDKLISMIDNLSELEKELLDYG